MQDADPLSSASIRTAHGVGRSPHGTTVREAASAPRLLGWHAGTLLDLRTGRRSDATPWLAAYGGSTATTPRSVKV